ncbi:MAG: hypothetical protein GTN36_02300 [Candidatus Aenigmarchaeota archaeon]|nr:hypothetical protein [Candidatus Aenigmarchaeota archaeon]
MAAGSPETMQEIRLCLEDLKKFNKFQILDGEVYIFSEELGITLPFDLDDEKLVKLFDISERQLQFIRNYQSKKSIVPEEMKDKYCILFGGRVLDSTDTKEDFETLKKEYENHHLHCSYYYPETKPSSPAEDVTEADITVEI